MWFDLVQSTTDYRCECVSKKVSQSRAIFISIESYTTTKKRIGINLIPVTVSQ
jgi:hypothetical protein